MYGFDFYRYFLGSPFQTNCHRTKRIVLFYYVIVFLNINGTNELYLKKNAWNCMHMSVQKCETGETENTSKITFRRTQTDNDLHMYVFS